ncbi:hypothetical protein [Rhodococcus sp. BH5]|uniref:hypothetical protein n=1 Tax=Rhodococcus sp. BH5 TaxID=2871702 RepID=UPI0022CD4247|nr:hypothetical protein [Rhodococcus sp. BH5]MCZ9635278.1 hypothetical protein [Rhodococcus sp. BH5]
MLLALCTLSVTRVKDLAADSDKGAWEGTDPMIAAYGFARSATAAAYVSLALTVSVFVQLVVTTGVIKSALVASALALVAHLGARIWFLLGYIRYQVDSLAGQRSVRPPRLMKAS